MLIPARPDRGVSQPISAILHYRAWAEWSRFCTGGRTRAFCVNAGDEPARFLVQRTITNGERRRGAPVCPEEEVCAMTIRSVGSRASICLAGACLMVMAAVPVAAEENSPIQSGLRVAVQNKLAENVSAIAEAQAAPAAAAKPNSGKITFTSNFELLPGTAYVFRGITQESDPEITMCPSGGVGSALPSSDTGALRTVSVNTGVWNSLHPGSSGEEGPTGKLHYEEDYYATLTLAFSKASFATTFTSYTSPNGSFGTTNEIGVRAWP